MRPAYQLVRDRDRDRDRDRVRVRVRVRARARARARARVRVRVRVRVKVRPRAPQQLLLAREAERRLAQCEGSGRGPARAAQRRRLDGDAITRKVPGRLRSVDAAKGARAQPHAAR